MIHESRRDGFARPHVAAWLLSLNASHIGRKAGRQEVKDECSKSAGRELGWVYLGSGVVVAVAKQTFSGTESTASMHQRQQQDDARIRPIDRQRVISGIAMSICVCIYIIVVCIGMFECVCVCLSCYAGKVHNVPSHLSLVACATCLLYFAYLKLNQAAKQTTLWWQLCRRAQLG